MRFRVFVNDTLACTAGVSGLGVLAATVTRVKRHPRSLHRDMAPHERIAALAESAELEVGGLDTTDGSGPDGEHLRWVKRALQPGDTVTIQLLPPGECDEPERRGS